MQKSELERIKNAIRTELEATIDEQIMNGLKTIQNSNKIQFSTMQNSIEMMSQQLSMAEKAFNLKIGSIKGHEARAERRNNQPSDILAEFDNYDEFQLWFEAQKNKKNGNDGANQIAQENDIPPM